MSWFYYIERRDMRMRWYTRQTILHTHALIGLYVYMVDEMIIICMIEFENKLALGRRGCVHVNVCSVCAVCAVCELQHIIKYCPIYWPICLKSNDLILSVFEVFEFNFPPSQNNKCGIGSCICRSICTHLKRTPLKICATHIYGSACVFVCVFVDWIGSNACLPHYTVQD